MSTETKAPDRQAQDGQAEDRPIADSVPKGWVERAPNPLRPYLRLARYDRPIGFWLLGAPGWFGIALANVDATLRASDALVALLIAIGAVAMRGAGCTYNDIIDRDLDAQVARTADRPLPAGTVTLRAAWMFLFAQCAVGLGVLLSLPRPAQLVALLALPLVAGYPFMKRITWFPQAWLGLTFNWAVLVGFAASAGELRTEALVAYAGLAVWTFGYDTIYAHQDREDDALVGVKSTARFFGAHSRLAVGVSYAIAAALIFASVRLSAPITVAAATGAVFAGLLAIQVVRVKFDDAASCIAWFRFNRVAILAASAVLAATPVVIAATLG